MWKMAGDLSWPEKSVESLANLRKLSIIIIAILFMPLSCDMHG